MKYILLTDMSILMTVLSDIIVLILPSLGVTYHLKCDIIVLKYLSFTRPNKFTINGFICLKSV